MNSPQLSLLPPNQKQDIDKEQLSSAAREVLEEIAIAVVRQSVSPKINSKMTPVQMAVVLYSSAIGIKRHPKDRAAMKPWTNMEEMVNANFSWMQDSTNRRSIMYERSIIQALDITEELLIYSGHMLSPVTLSSLNTASKSTRIPIWKIAATPVVFIATFIVAYVVPQPVIVKVKKIIK